MNRNSPLIAIMYVLASATSPNAHAIDLGGVWDSVKEAGSEIVDNAAKLAEGGGETSNKGEVSTTDDSATESVGGGFMDSDQEWHGKGEPTKEGFGTVGGALLGAYLGSKVGDGDGRKLSIVAGALLGGYLGNRFGAHLDEEDKKALAEMTENAYGTGEPQKYENPESGNTIEVTPEGEEEQIAEQEIEYDPNKVHDLPPTRAEHRTYKVKQFSNLRSGAGTDYPKVGHAERGQVLQITGEIDAGSKGIWKRVSQGGVVIGYIHGTLVEPVDEMPTIMDRPDGPTKSEKIKETLVCQKANVTIENKLTGHRESADTLVCPDSKTGLHVISDT